jgi:hypothetical protein
MKIQMMKKEEEVEKLEEEVVTLRVKIVKLNKNVEERETSTSSVENVEEKHSRLLEKKNEEKSKSYAEVLKGRNHGQQESKKKSIIEIHLQEDPPHSSNKEASIIMKGSTEEKIMINQGRNSEGLHHKEDHSLPGM